MRLEEGERIRAAADLTNQRNTSLLVPKKNSEISKISLKSEPKRQHRTLSKTGA